MVAGYLDAAAFGELITPGWKGRLEIASASVRIRLNSLSVCPF